MRVFQVALLAAALVGCNALLGIEEATLDPDASAGGGSAGSGGSTGNAGTTAGAGGTGGSACSLMASDPCNRCIAQRCCDAYDACNGNAGCKQALSEYNVCVGVSFTNDAGGTCDETFATSLALAQPLATCAFLSSATDAPAGCAETCKGKPVGGDICSTYCACMASICPEKMFEVGSCLANCAAFTEPQLTCRPYHCGLATKAKANNDEPGRVTHCGHSFGEALCP